MGDDGCDVGEDGDGRCVIDLEAWLLPDIVAARGLFIRLANDWELLDVWSSGRYFDRCVPRLEAFRPTSDLSVVEAVR